jgi:hypothetical protein
MSEVLLPLLDEEWKKPPALTKGRPPRTSLGPRVFTQRKLPSIASERPRGHPLRDRGGSPMKR